MSDLVPDLGEINAMSKFEWRKLQKQYSGLTKDHQTAFDHVYGSAVLAKRHGAGIAQVSGDFHEGSTWARTRRERHGPQDTYADLYNNAVGRRLAKGLSDQDLAAAAFRAVVDGRAIVSRSADARIPTDVGVKARPGRLSHHAVMDERADFEARHSARPRRLHATLEEREDQAPWVSFEGG